VTRNGERLGNLLLFGQALQSSKAATTSYLPEFSPLSASCSTTVRLWIKPCTRIEEARPSIESPPDLRTLRAERVSLLRGIAMILDVGRCAF
jgi:hypothetical protein